MQTGWGDEDLSLVESLGCGAVSSMEPGIFLVLGIVVLGYFLIAPRGKQNIIIQRL